MSVFSFMPEATEQKPNMQLVDSSGAVFLGPDLPAEEIALAALRLEARVVAISAVDPGSAEALPGQVKALRGRLPPGVQVLVGGTAAEMKKDALRGEGVEVLGSFGELRVRLRALRAGG
jgi:MerR family transcriptional regulator, light-induced transcriptional regulator